MDGRACWFWRPRQNRLFRRSLHEWDADEVGRSSRRRGRRRQHARRVRSPTERASPMGRFFGSAARLDSDRGRGAMAANPANHNQRCPRNSSLRYQRTSLIGDALSVGERTRLACWRRPRWRRGLAVVGGWASPPRRRELLPTLSASHPRRDARKRLFWRRRQNQHARARTLPKSCRSQSAVLAQQSIPQRGFRVSE